MYDVQPDAEPPRLQRSETHSAQRFGCAIRGDDNRLVNCDVRHRGSFLSPRS